MRYVLPSGSGRHRTLGGLDRHPWGDLHSRCALGLLAALALHVLLHGRWILAVLRGRPREGSGPRLLLGLLALAAILAVALAPCGGEVERSGEPGGGGRGGGAAAVSLPGRMTLVEIEAATGVPVGYLIERPGLPADAPTDVGAARLAAEYPGP